MDTSNRPVGFAIKSTFSRDGGSGQGNIVRPTTAINKSIPIKVSGVGNLINNRYNQYFDQPKAITRPTSSTMLQNLQGAMTVQQNPLAQSQTLQNIKEMVHHSRQSKFQASPANQNQMRGYERPQTSLNVDRAPLQDLRMNRSHSKGSLQEVISPMKRNSVDEFKKNAQKLMAAGNHVSKSQTLEAGQLRTIANSNFDQRLRQSVDVRPNQMDTIGHDEPALTITTGNFTKQFAINNSLKKRPRCVSAQEFKPFHNLGDQYWIPIRDHKYRINATNQMGKSTESYMGQIVKRAKSIVPPDKYSKMLDWKRHSNSQPRGVMAKARKLTITAETIEISKQQRHVGPQTYQQWIRPKTKGFYKQSEDKISIVASIAHDKKSIPGPSVYKGRGKDMYERIKAGPSTIKFGDFNAPAKENIRMTKIKKNNKPGPQTFEVAKSLDACALRSTINQKMDQAKNVNMFEKILKQKKRIPGVGTYKTEKACEVISTGPACYARKR